MKHLRRFFWILLALVGAGSALLTGCEPREDIITRDAGATLTATVDTVFFDTVFVSRGSASRRFWVHNRNAKAVRVDEIALVGAASAVARFELIIDGRRGPARRGFDLRGRDSLLVIATVTIDPNAADIAFIVTDDVRLTANGTTRTVKLLAYGENARYYNASSGFAPVVACDTTWTAARPIVLLKNTVVDSSCTLIIAPGTRVYVAPGASLVVLGRLQCGALGPDVPGVTFRGLRRDDYYDTRDPRYETLDIRFPKYAFTPGQWGTILFRPSRGLRQSDRNEIFNTSIRNATYGVLIDNPRVVPGHKLLIESSTIRTAYTVGIYGAGAGTVEVINTVVAHCGERAVVGVGGGTWRLAHCSIDMSSGPFTGSRRATEALAFNNAVEVAENVVRSAKTDLTVENSILWSGLTDERGQLQNEILLLREGSTSDSLYTFRHNVLQTPFARFNIEGDKYNRPTRESGTNILSQNPLYRNIDYRNLDLRLDSLLSPARRLGKPVSPAVPVDLRNAPRSSVAPSAGAYESVP